MNPDFMNLRSDPKFWDWLSTPASPDYNPEEARPMSSSENNQGNWTTMEEEFEKWRRMVYGTNEHGKAATEDDYKSTMIHETWAPRWKWFRPPMWKIFRWAFKIDRKVYTGVYPVGIAYGSDDQHQGENTTVQFGTGGVRINQKAKGGPGSVQTQIGLQFTVNPYVHPNVEKAAEIRKEQMKKWANEHGVHLYGDDPDVKEKEKKDGEDQC